MLSEFLQTPSEINVSCHYLRNIYFVIFPLVRTEWDVERYCDYLTMRQAGMNRKHLQYDPRTVVGLLGKVIRHGAGEVRGERMCLAYYMRDKVHERLGFPPGRWMNVSVYS